MPAGLSQSTEVLLNPRLSSADAKKLQSLAGQYALAGHVWIASSGSTRALSDSVKLIALSHKALRASAKAVNQHLESTAQDRWVQVLPRFHVGGLGIEVRAELSGAEVVSGLSPSLPQWNPDYFCELCHSQKVTLGSLVPTQIFDLIQRGLKAPKSMRAVVVGGSALAPELYLQSRKLGWPLLPSFGMTEACSQVATASLNSLQTPIKDLQKPPPLRILSHLDAREDVDGGLKLKGASLLTGYAQIQDGEYVWVDPKNSEGWLDCEDLVQIEGGFLRPLGRRGDYIKILGEGVSLLLLQQKLEECLLQRGFATTAAVVIARSDRRQGSELILVFDSSVPEKAQEDVRNDFNSQVQPYERAHHIEELDHIPRSELGKLKRTELMHKLRLT